MKHHHRSQIVGETGKFPPLPPKKKTFSKLQEIGADYPIRFRLTGARLVLGLCSACARRVLGVA